MNELEHIGFSYQEDLPEQIASDFLDDVRRGGMVARGESRPIGYYAGIEWAVSTLVVVYVLRPYFEAFLGEAGKDHYAALKRAILRLFMKIYGAKPETRPSGRSLVFSVRSVVRDGRSIKFVFPEGISHEVYERIVEELLAILAEHHAEGGGDRLAEIVSVSSGMGGALYVEYSVSEGGWVLLDPKDEEGKRRKAAPTSKDGGAGLPDGS